MDDIFPAWFGCFCMWNHFSELLDDLACLEEFLTILLKNRNMFFRSSLFDDFTLCLLDSL